MLTPRDVLDAIGHEAPRAKRRRLAAHPLLAHLSAGEGLTTDELVTRSGLSVPEVHTALLDLELGGEVDRLRDGRFQLRRPQLPKE